MQKLISKTFFTISKQIKSTPLPAYISNKFLFSEYRKQQEIKKKIMDTHEAEALHQQINQRDFSFSIISGP